jgi:hypothetical protein
MTPTAHEDQPCVEDGEDSAHKSCIREVSDDEVDEAAVLMDPEIDEGRCKAGIEQEGGAVDVEDENSDEPATGFLEPVEDESIFDADDEHDSPDGGLGKVYREIIPDNEAAVDEAVRVSEPRIDNGRCDTGVEHESVTVEDEDVSATGFLEPVADESIFDANDEHDSSDGGLGGIFGGIIPDNEAELNEAVRIAQPRRTQAGGEQGSQATRGW